jgi:hypothetical protein
MSNQSPSSKAAATFMAILGAALVTLAGPTAAQENTSEIVVTADRYVQGFAQERMPAVTLERRADFLFQTITVINDTRESKVRQEELTATLRAMTARAKASGGRIQLSTTNDTVINPFEDSVILGSIVPGSRPDTSQVSMIVKTPVDAADTRDVAFKRIDEFLTGLSRTGRTEVLRYAIGLSVVRPGQYRAALAAAMAADAKIFTDAYGPGYSAMVTTLERPIAWRQTGPLTLTLFQPHTLTIRKTE